MATKCTILGKKYEVEYVFLMVGNYYFNRKGVSYLVDAEDVSVWAEEAEFEGTGIEAAIAFAKEVAPQSDDGIFWWTAKEIERRLPYHV